MGLQSKLHEKLPETDVNGTDNHEPACNALQSQTLLPGDAPDQTNGDVPQDDICRVELPQFEGPLDLLLHLITKHELDILDIPIAFITEKYLEYLSLMRVLSIDIASEYLVMAATLAHIKSKSLLPTVPADQDDPLDEQLQDPREELVRRLLEYQKYKAAAVELTDRCVLDEDVFGPTPIDAPSHEPPPLAPANVFSLIDAFQQIAKRHHIRLDHEIDLERISITERIGQLMEQLQHHKACSLEQLLDPTGGASDLIITFLALLEMTRLRITRLHQPCPLAPLHVSLAVIDDKDPASATLDRAALDNGETSSFDGAQS